MKRWGLVAGVSAVAVLAAAGADAATKAKYYEACAAPVTQARELVPPPPPDIAGTAKKAGDVANVASKIPGLGGLGGAFGGLGKIASTAQTVAKYSDILGDAAKFAGKMKQDYPDDAARYAAYGDRMSADADKVNQAGDKLDEAHDCLAKANEELRAGFESKAIKEKEAKERQKELDGFAGDMASIVADARLTMNTNIKSYNDALNGETSGLNLGSLVSVAGVAAGAAGITPASVMGLPKVPGVPDNPEAQMQAYQLAANAQKHGYSASGSQQANYAALARAASETNTSALNLPSTPDGSSAIVQQAAAYRAQVVGQGAATSVDPAMAQFGTLSQLGSLGALSRGPLGAANVASVAASAIGGGGAAAPAPAAPAVALAPDVMSGLGKVGESSSKYMGALSRLGSQADKVATLKSTVSVALK